MLLLLKLMRPKQWIKNLFVVAPLVFSMTFYDSVNVIHTIIAVAVFIAASSAVYVMNDICDVKADRKHPKKKHRPIASGEVSVPTAMVLLVALVCAGIYGIRFLPINCAVITTIYILLNIFYSFKLKHIAILDVSLIAVGFVLRVLMGAAAISVDVSPWIILATFLLALFLGFGKRRHEVTTPSGNKTRSSLNEYTAELLDNLINVTCAAALMCYAIYAVDVARTTHKVEFVYTVGFVALGLFRYLHFIYVSNKGDSPENAIYQDRLFLLNLLLWLGISLRILLP
ncbi:MAG: decaprenyl-phosphate phosphoribosyltransferase [Proteobacteria bacterium]|nr:decaprenyl-phosphate phosphoribosyltransferase [Pseudomonadota bacterium]